MIQVVVMMVVQLGIALVLGRAAPSGDARFWAVIAWLTVLSSLGGYVSYFLVSRSLGPTTVSTLLYLTAPTTMLWLWLMFGSPIPLIGYVGLAVVALGVTLTLAPETAPRVRTQGYPPACHRSPQ